MERESLEAGKRGRVEASAPESLQTSTLFFDPTGLTWEQNLLRAHRLEQQQTSERFCQFCNHKFIRYEIVFPMNEACDGCRADVLGQVQRAKNKTEEETRT